VEWAFVNWPHHQKNPLTLWTPSILKKKNVGQRIWGKIVVLLGTIWGTPLWEHRSIIENVLGGGGGGGGGGRGTW